MPKRHQTSLDFDIERYQETLSTLDKRPDLRYPVRYRELFDKVVVVLLQENPRLPFEEVIQKAHRFVRLALTTKGEPT